MRILQINAVYKKLSTGRNVAELNNEFRRMGHEAIAAYSVGNVEDTKQEYLIGGRTGQKVHALLSRITGLQGYYSAGATRKLLRFMNDYQPEVVILNNLHANYIHMPMLLKCLAKKDIPTVVVLHDCWFYTGKCCYYTVQNCYKWKTKCEKCPAVKQYNKSWLFDRSGKMLRDKKKYFRAIPRLGVIAVSDWLLNEVRDTPVFQNAWKKSRIYNWIDMQLFHPIDTAELRAAMNLTEKKILLGVAAEWDTRKGIEVFKQLAGELTEDEQLILVGKLADDLCLPENILHIPRTDSVEKLAEIYSMADVFVQPSLEETFGKVTAEALCCGTPVVCFNSTATPELIGPGCGAVVEPGDVKGMLKEVRKVLTKGKEVYTDNCIAFAAELFEMKKNCRQYLEFCLEIASMKN